LKQKFGPPYGGGLRLGKPAFANSAFQGKRGAKAVAPKLEERRRAGSSGNRGETL